MYFVTKTQKSISKMPVDQENASTIAYETFSMSQSGFF